MSQKAYQWWKLFIEVKIDARIESLWSWIIALVNAKFLFKNNFEHKIFICLPIFKILLHILQQI